MTLGTRLGVELLPEPKAEVDLGVQDLPLFKILTTLCSVILLRAIVAEFIVTLRTVLFRVGVRKGKGENINEGGWGGARMRVGVRVRRRARERM